MKRFANVLSWEMNDHMKVLIFLFVLPVLSYLLAVGYLHLESGISTVQNASGSPPMTDSSTVSWLLTYPRLVPGFWIILALFIPVLAVVTFRYDRDRGYAFSLSSLPYTKAELYAGKLLSVFVFSLLAAFIPLVAVALILNVDILRVVLSVITSPGARNMAIFTVYFELFVISVSVLFSVLFRDMFLPFLLSFFVVVIPYFSALLDYPPFLFVGGISVSGPSPFTWKYLLPGFVIPAVLLFASLVLFIRRDVM